MLQKCIKLRIAKPYADFSWDQLGHILRETMHAARSSANFVMRECYLHTMAKLAGKEVPKKYFYAQLVAQHPTIARHIISTMERVSTKKWNQHAKSVLKSEISLPTFKSGLPVHLHNKSYKIQAIDGNYLIDVQLRSQVETPTRYKFYVFANDKSTKTILDRLISADYRQGEAQILQDRKGKWYFVVPYSCPASYHDLDKSNIMGVDLGITKVAYWAFGGSYKRGFIDGGEIEAFRRRVRARRIQIQNQGKYCGSGRIGHGTSRRLLPVDNLSEKESNFRDTCNHRYARYIVDEALRMKCGIIQLEDLTGINRKSKFLKNWPYFDLQTKIINKAAEHGIEVRKINPEYTSQRCSNCGHIDGTNRIDQATFVCSACGFGSLYHCFACGAKQQAGGSCQKCDSSVKHVTVNADYNAARNLTITDIDKIIAKQLENKMRTTSTHL